LITGIKEALYYLPTATVRSIPYKAIFVKKKVTLCQIKIKSELFFTDLKFKSELFQSPQDWGFGG